MAYKKKLRGYDFALFGDNHKQFTARSGKTTVINHGAFMRRKADEVEHMPRMYVLFNDGSFEEVFVECKQDKFIDTNELKSLIGEIESVDLNGFVEQLEDIQQNEINFKDYIIQYLKQKGASKRTKRILLGIIDKD